MAHLDHIVELLGGLVVKTEFGSLRRNSKDNYHVLSIREKQTSVDTFKKRPSGELYVVVGDSWAIRRRRRGGKTKRFNERRDQTFSWERLTAYIRGYVDTQDTIKDNKRRQQEMREASRQALMKAGLGGLLGFRSMRPLREGAISDVRTYPLQFDIDDSVGTSTISLRVDFKTEHADTVIPALIELLGGEIDE
jgi:hypothetical protein